MLFLLLYFEAGKQLAKSKRDLIKQSRPKLQWRPNTSGVTVQ